MNKPSKSKAEQQAIDEADRRMRQAYRTVADKICDHKYVPRQTMGDAPDIITRMEAMQERFGASACILETREEVYVSGMSVEEAVSCRESFPSLLQSAENERRLQLNDRPESEREILRCAPPFDAQAEHEADLRYESRVDYESWQCDGPAERDDQ